MEKQDSVVSTVPVETQRFCNTISVFYNAQNKFIILRARPNYYFFLLFLYSFSLEYLSYYHQKEKDTPTPASAVQAAVYPVKFSSLNISTGDELEKANFAESFQKKYIRSD